MKKHAIALFIVNLFIINIYSQQQVSREEIKNVAIHTLYDKAKILKISTTVDIQSIGEYRNEKRNVLMYEVVFSNKAAILLSGSKACLPVLGYYIKEDKESIFDTTNIDMPCGLKDMIRGYAQQIEWCFSQDTLELYHFSQWQELQQNPMEKSLKSAIPIVGHC
jgi:hypothetical protein